MNAGTIPPKQTKTEYSAAEVAQELGLTVEDLRVLIRNHVAQTDDDLNNLALASFHASDLLVLRLLASQHRTAATPDPSE